MADWEFTHSVDAKVSPRQAWDFWTNVDNWALDTALEWVRLDRPFGTGARGTTKSRGVDQPVEWIVKEAFPPRSAVIEIAVPGAVVAFHWTFEPGPEGGARLTQRASVSGPKAADYSPGLSADLAPNMPVGMQKLADAMNRSLGIE